MAQQTSKAVVSVEQHLDRMNGVDEKRNGHCETHGDFVESHFSGKGNIKEPGWSGCPECQQEEWDREVNEQAKREQQDRDAWRIDRLIEKSGIPSRFLRKSFDDFEPINPKSTNHLKKVREYADLLCTGDHEGRCLLMLGRVGNGKTHLACSLLSQVIRSTGKPSHYWTFSELVRSVKGSFAKGAEYSEQDVYEDFARAYLVVLDEVGMQNFTEFEQAVAYEAINARYLAERPTVLISNLQATELPACVGERVVDRLREGGGRALDFDWKSYRVGGAA